MMGAPPDLTIRELKVRTVELLLERPVETASGMVFTAPLVLTDLWTEEGIIGSSYVFCYTPLALGAVAQLLERFEPLIKGHRVVPVALAARLQHRMRLLGAQGLVGIALAGIDMAAWDALAKAVGLPLVRLLGGEPQPVAAYASLRTMQPSKAAQEAEEAAAAGFKAVKIKIGHPALETDLVVVRAVRQAVTDAVQVMVDYNQCLSVPEALVRAAALQDEGVSWIEEPTRADDYLGHARIARDVRVGIQLGENWWGPCDMAKSLAAEASDYVMVDAMKIGGVSGWLRAAALAEVAGTPLSSHIFPEISAHLLAISPTADWLEYMDLVSPILKEPLRVDRGDVIVPARPGAGLEWDEATLAQVRAR
jgi:mandelate racemase